MCEKKSAAPVLQLHQKKKHNTNMVFSIRTSLSECNASDPDSIKTLTKCCLDVLHEIPTSTQPVALDYLKDIDAVFQREELAEALVLDLLPDLLICAGHDSKEVATQIATIFQNICLTCNPREIFLSILDTLSSTNAADVEALMVGAVLTVVSRAKRLRWKVDMLQQSVHVLTARLSFRRHSHMLEEKGKNLSFRSSESHPYTELFRRVLAVVQGLLGIWETEFSSLVSSPPSQIPAVEIEHALRADPALANFRNLIVQLLLELLVHQTQCFFEQPENSQIHTSQLSDTVNNNSSLLHTLLSLFERCHCHSAEMWGYGLQRQQLDELAATYSENDGWDDYLSEINQEEQKHIGEKRALLAKMQAVVPEWSVQGVGVFLSCTATSAPPPASSLPEVTLYVSALICNSQDFHQNFQVVEAGLALLTAVLSTVPSSSWTIHNTPDTTSESTFPTATSRSATGTPTTIELCTITPLFESLTGVLMSCPNSSLRTRIWNLAKELVQKLEDKSRFDFLRSAILECSYAPVAALCVHQFKEEIRLAWDAQSSSSPPSSFASSLSWSVLCQVLKVQTGTDLLHRLDVYTAALNCCVFLVLRAGAGKESKESKESKEVIEAKDPLQLKHLLVDFPPVLDNMQHHVQVAQEIVDTELKSDGDPSLNASAMLMHSRLCMFQDLLSRIEELTTHF